MMATPNMINPATTSKSDKMAKNTFIAATTKSRRRHKVTMPTIVAKMSDSISYYLAAAKQPSPVMAMKMSFPSIRVSPEFVW